MTEPRFTDPLRKVVRRVKEGAGSDLILLECGHEITRAHRREWTGRTRCHGCRVWRNQERA